MSRSLKSPLFLFIMSLVLIGVLAFFGPEEKSLGSNVRIVYLHGAWVLAAQVAFALAAAAGLVAILTRRADLHAWSAAAGRTGIIFWISYLPLSLWAMQANWNGLFLAEPRFRLALTFAVVGLLLQGGLWLLNRPSVTSTANVLFIVTLRFVFARADYIMHPPPSPIFSSGLWNIILFFVLLNLLTLVAAYFLTRWWLESQRVSESAIH